MEAPSAMTVNSGCSDAFVPAILPCGITLKNRLVKAAMYEHLASLSGGPPNAYHFNLYSQWAKYGWGMIMTGNVQVSAKHLTLGRDIVIPDVLNGSTILPFRCLADAIHGLRNPQFDTKEQPIAIMQLSHAGRQSSNIIGGRVPFEPPLAPSPVPVRSRSRNLLSQVFDRFMFQTPKEMMEEDIEQVIEEFVRGAALAHMAGFDGIQLHVAHGYLLSTFLSTTTNLRTDEFSAENALELLHRIVIEIRHRVPEYFALGIKINSGDYVNSMTAHESLEHRAFQHVCTISTWPGIDFIEISGGDYECPDFMSQRDDFGINSMLRQAFFSQFSQHIKEALTKQVPVVGSTPLILLTGGFSSPGHVFSALASEHADLLGFARSSVLCPHLPLLLEAASATNEKTERLWQPFKAEPDILSGISKWFITSIENSLMGVGVEMAWYTLMLRKLALHHSRNSLFEPDYNVNGLWAIFRMWFWIESTTPVDSVRTERYLYSFIIALAIIYAWYGAGITL